MTIHSARKGVVEDVSIIDGEVRCDVEDLYESGSEYNKIRIEQPTSGKIVVPEVGSKVVLRPMYGSKPIITGFLDIPSDTFDDEAAVEEGSTANQNSVAFVLGEDSEKIIFERTNSGYKVNIDVNSDVTISAGGTVVVDSSTVKLGGDTGTKIVARKGDTVETSDPLTGTNTGEITGGASNTEAK